MLLRLVRTRLPSVCALRPSSSAPATAEEELQKRQHTLEFDERDGFERTFASQYPDLLPQPFLGRRNKLAEKLNRNDLLNRRKNIHIPEFYVGSLVAVTYADSYAPNRLIRFMGICIVREKYGADHRIILRNVVDGLGVEVPIYLYHPTVRNIEVIQLARHRDPHMRYLRDAPLEYSTYPMNMAAIPTPAGAKRVPINTLKVPLRPPPWTERWQRYEYEGIDKESIWKQTTAWFKFRYFKSFPYVHDKYDIVKHMREDVPREDQLDACEHLAKSEQ